MLKGMNIRAWAAVAALSVASMAGCTMRSNTGSRSPARPTPERDRQILIDLAHRQSEGLQLVTACVSKAQHQKPAAFCRQFVRDHEKAVQVLQDWLETWYPQSKSGSPSEHSDQFRGFLEQMRTATGQAFDEAFLGGMRVHHRQLSEETQRCQTRWICQWFRDCLS